MAFAKKLVTRTDDTSGDTFILQEAPSGSSEYAQGVVTIDETGAPSGITTNPLKTAIIGTVTTTVTGTVTTTVTGTPNVNIASQTSALAIDDSTPIDVNIASGISNPLPTSVTGTVSVTSAAETFVKFKSSGLVDSLVDIATGSCQLRQVRAILDPTIGVNRYLMFFNSTTLPSNGTAPDWWMLLPKNGEASEDIKKDELDFSTGCTFAVSSTLATLTITTASECLIFGVRV